MKAYVLIQTGADRVPLAERLRALPQVVAAEDLTGPYDAIAEVWPLSTQHLAKEIIEEIRRVPGVMRALPVTLMPHWDADESTPARPGPQDAAA